MKSTNRQWFSVVCTPIDEDMRHLNVKMLWNHEADDFHRNIDAILFRVRLGVGKTKCEVLFLKETLEIYKQVWKIHC